MACLGFACAHEARREGDPSPKPPAPVSASDSAPSVAAAPAPSRLNSRAGIHARPGPPRWSEFEPSAPWWAGLETGAYALSDSGEAGEWLLSVGHSTGHHHAAEGLLDARVQARLGLRRVAEGEPRLLDLYINTDRQFFVLYGVPSRADGAPELHAPPPFGAPGRHRVGRHLYEGDKHLFLECDVEGPLANPDWGSDRVSAALHRSP
ncbi:MAG: hypothetical protein AAFZ18_14555 [Myxococcota bacterium]